VLFLPFFGNDKSYAKTVDPSLKGILIRKIKKKQLHENLIKN